MQQVIDLVLDSPSPVSISDSSQFPQTIDLESYLDSDREEFAVKKRRVIKQSHKKVHGYQRHRIQPEESKVDCVIVLGSKEKEIDDRKHISQQSEVCLDIIVPGKESEVINQTERRNDETTQNTDVPSRAQTRQSHDELTVIESSVQVIESWDLPLMKRTLNDLSKKNSSTIPQKEPERQLKKRRVFAAMKKVHKLLNPRNKKQSVFPLFNDEDIGLDKAILFENQIETRMDDDCDTDQDIMDQADDTVKSDMFTLRAKLEFCDLKTIVNNIDIKQRIAFPDLYDRNGKFRDSNPTMPYQSLSKTRREHQEAQSEPQQVCYSALFTPRDGHDDEDSEY